MVGMGQRAKGWQHLKMDTTQPEDTWHNNFQTIEAPPDLALEGYGLAKVEPEYIPSGDTLPKGGIW